MDVPELEVFLALAEELHFGRTAERLYLSQSRVSRLVASLEREVGGALFERTTRKVRLTPLGERLRADLKPTYAAMRLAIQAARRDAMGAAGVLRVGFTATTEGPALSGVIKSFRARSPGCEVTLREISILDPYASLRRDEVDVLCTWLPVNEPDLTGGPAFAQFDRVLAVASDHHLASRHWVCLEDLADEEVARLPSGFPAAMNDMTFPPRTSSGRLIRQTEPVRTLGEILSLVAQGRTVLPTVASIPWADRSDIVVVPIADLPPAKLGLTWRSAHENARIRALAQAGRPVAAAARDVVPGQRTRAALTAPQPLAGSL